MLMSGTSMTHDEEVILTLIVFWHFKLLYHIRMVPGTQIVNGRSSGFRRKVLFWRCS